MDLMRLLVLIPRCQNLKTGPLSDKMYVIPYIKNTAVLSLMSKNLFQKIIYSINCCEWYERF